MPALRVDGSSVVEELVEAEELFADALAPVPRVATRAERRALLREANEAIVSQVRGYYDARTWAEGEADAVVREFLCECGDPRCEASVAVTVGAASATPVLGPGHA